jgi:hypothetical protein
MARVFICGVEDAIHIQFCFRWACTFSAHDLGSTVATISDGFAHELRDFA